ncbi:hypothetical protein ACFW9F_20785 [Streptomyces sp. NPDC059506]|uniref:hypothetical protein n=1 Tax=Streptomyces TaxID=1883 RepID=UPI0015FCE30D|nr:MULTISPECIES: hypothetical protein [unclassified Streptomyces]MCZ2524256.1 hypothetical protein [Streptomyces sp. HB2AG]QMV21723.1 hypothetical protein GQS52_07920 [Streptomyces sp. SCUT-3]
MIVTVIVACEVAFWAVLAAGLGARYLLGLRRTGAVLLACVPVVDLVLLAATAADLRAGAAADWQHGLAAVYLGFSVSYGHYLVRWADGHAAHRLGGGPKPAGPPKYGAARARHEWAMCGRTLAGAAVAAALLQVTVWWVGDPGRTAVLGEWQARMLWVCGIAVVVALSYTVWPKAEPRARAEEKETASR